MDYMQVSSSANLRYQIHLELNSQTLKLGFYITVSSNKNFTNQIKAVPSLVQEGPVGCYCANYRHYLYFKNPGFSFAIITVTTDVSKVLL